jgi:hypothetical protein
MPFENFSAQASDLIALTSRETSFAWTRPILQTKEIRPLTSHDFDPWVKLNSEYLLEEGYLCKAQYRTGKVNSAHRLMLGIGGAPSKMTNFVATGALDASYGTIGLVGGVYTVPERRRQSYARCSMLLLMNDALKRQNNHLIYWRA